MRIVISTLLALALSSCARPVLRLLPLPKGCTAWAALPMTISMDSSARAYANNIKAACRVWEKALGRSVFVWAPEDDGTADVLVVMGDVPGKAVGWTSATCVGEGHLLQTILLEPGMDAMRATAFGVHELGHTLGLGHSETEASVMHPSVAPSLMGYRWDDDMGQTILATDARTALALHPDRR